RSGPGTVEHFAITVRSPPCQRTLIIYSLNNGAVIQPDDENLQVYTREIHISCVSHVICQSRVLPLADLERAGRDASAKGRTLSRAGENRKRRLRLTHQLDAELDARAGGVESRVSSHRGEDNRRGERTQRAEIRNRHNGAQRASVGWIRHRYLCLQAGDSN